MEREREIVKLANVLRRIARGADYAAWHNRSDAARFCVAQYNRVLARLTELEPAVAPLFTPLVEDASPQVVRLATRELAAYFEEDRPHRHHRAHQGCGARVHAEWSPRGGWCW